MSIPFQAEGWVKHRGWTFSSLAVSLLLSGLFVVQILCLFQQIMHWSCLAVFLLSLTDFAAWATEDRCRFARTDRDLCSFHVPEWLFHSAQLTLPQGSAAGNICSVSTGHPGHSAPSYRFSVYFLLHVTERRWTVNHSKMKTHLNPLIFICK